MFEILLTANVVTPITQSLIVKKGGNVSNIKISLKDEDETDSNIIRKV